MHRKNIDLVVLADRLCTTSILYLEYLYRNGYRPKKVYICNFLYAPSFQSRKAKLLYLISKDLYKKRTRPWYQEPSLFEYELYDEMQKSFDFKAEMNLKNVDFNKYCDDVEEITVFNYRDPYFQKLIFSDPHSFYLYTNGDIVPKEIFEKNIKILHVHPGIVPYVKGSDGVLWSLLERGKLGYSCFFMNAGIDTGYLIYQEEFEPLKFPKIRPLYETYAQEIYAAFLKACDPHFRARVLLKTLQNVEGDLSRLHGKIQDQTLGKEFFSMHPLLKKKCILEFF